MLEQNWKSVTKLNGVKNAIMQVTYFLNGPMLNFLLSYYFILRESDLREIYPQPYPWSPNGVENFSVLML